MVFVLFFFIKGLSLFSFFVKKSVNRSTLLNQKLKQKYSAFLWVSLVLGSKTHHKIFVKSCVLTKLL